MNRRRAQGFAPGQSSSSQSASAALDITTVLQQATRLLQTRRWAHAEDLCRQVLAAQPQNLDALNLMGLIFREIGDRAKARAWLEQAIQVDPNFVEARSNLGTLLREMGLGAEAEVQFQAALEINPDHVLSLYNLGVLYQQRFQLQQALTCYQRVIEIQPQLADAHNNLGTVLRGLGRPQAAVESYQRALALREDPRAITNLGNALRKLGDLEGAKAAYEQALTWDPGFSLAYNNLGNTLRDLGQLSMAIHRYRQALQLRPRYVNALIHLGSALVEAEEWEAAAEQLQLALTYQPDSLRALIALAELQITQGDLQTALETCQQGLDHDPENRLLLALKTVIYSEMGDQSTRQDLVRFESLIQVRQPDPPAGYEDLNAFHQDLIQVLQDHPTLVWERPPQSTRSGSQTGNLVEDLTDPLPALRGMITEQAQQGVQSLTADPDHPFLKDLPEELRLTDLWGVVIKTGGHQTPHIHPSAWLSGVYYLAVPETISPEDAEGKGWIEFGQAPDRFRCQSTQQTHRICPEVGKMILFPSYLYHHTIPHPGEQERISVAFDLVKGNARSPLDP